VAPPKVALCLRNVGTDPSAPQPLHPVPESISGDPNVAVALVRSGAVSEAKTVASVTLAFRARGTGSGVGRMPITGVHTCRADFRGQATFACAYRRVEAEGST
jgi:hypothetical protein